MENAAVLLRPATYRPTTDPWLQADLAALHAHRVACPDEQLHAA